MHVPGKFKRPLYVYRCIFRHSSGTVFANVYAYYITDPDFIQSFLKNLNCRNFITDIFLEIINIAVEKTIRVVGIYNIFNIVLISDLESISGRKYNLVKKKTRHLCKF